MLDGIKKEEPPTVLNGFKILEKIGEGGMGVVYRARQISLDRDVALKVLSSELAERDPSYISRFFNEARISAQLAHPHIVQAIDFGQDSMTGIYYFVMELVDGQSARTLLDTQGPLPEEKALHIGRCIASALQCASRFNIVHRDIKPENILLTSDGEPKLADLGLAKCLFRPRPRARPVNSLSSITEITGSWSKGPGQTHCGETVGTPWYMAPEQMYGDSAPVDLRADLYSLGATLFHLVTGQPPFGGVDARETMRTRALAPVPDARKVSRQVSLTTARLLNRLMRHDPAKRVQTPGELVTLLDFLLACLRRRQGLRMGACSQRWMKTWRLPEARRRRQGRWMPFRRR